MMRRPARTPGVLLAAVALSLGLCTRTLAEPLKVVGVLGNTSGMSDTRVPYAFYMGIAIDGRGRLYLSGASEGIPVCDQDGRCLAVLPLPQADGIVARSLMAKAGDCVFFVASDPGQTRSALYRINTASATVTGLTVEPLAAGPGAWAISQTLSPAGKLIVGQSEADKLQYRVISVDPATGQATPLFGLNEPKGAMRPWRHIIQAEPDGTIGIHHAGGVDWKGRYDAKGERVGEWIDGQILDGLRYHFGYGGALRRTDITGTKPSPGDCGSGAPEIRMPTQVVRDKDRYFFAGRGGAVEARWNGSNFDFVRRIGGLYLEDMVSADADLLGVAFTSSGNNDVQHFVTLPKSQPIGQLLDVNEPIYGRTVLTLVPAPYGLVAAYRDAKGTGVQFKGPAHLQFDVHLPEVKEVGQAAVLGKDLLLADPKSGVVWRRPLMDKTPTITVWNDKLPGVIGLATSLDAVFAASAKQVQRLSPDGAVGQASACPIREKGKMPAPLKAEWTCPVAYSGIRRLAATPEFVYVCDTAGNVVDQLDAKTGQQLARLGAAGEAGTALDRLSRPNAIAADLNAVYVADSGNGRVLVATTTLWRPDIRPLPREDNSPIVAVAIPAKLPGTGRMSLNVYDENDVTVRQLVCAQPSDAPVAWDGRDQYGQFARPGTYRYHGILAPKFRLRYVTSIGQSGNPPYRTADGKGSWGGVWGDVMDVCPVTGDPDSDILVLWAVEEGEGGLIRMSQDGVVRWKQHLDWWMKASQIAVTCDGTWVYLVASSAMGAREGQAEYGGTFNRPMLWRVDAATGAKRLYARETTSQPMFGEYLKGGRIVTDVAVRDGKLYITAPAQNTLFVADAKTGQQLAAWEIEAVSGVAFTPQGRLIAGSGSQIVEVDAAGKVTRVLAEAGGPVWDVDALADGAFVATVGEPRNQAIYFDSQGKETRALGRPGGRPRCGKMLPESFRNPVGLCVTGNGRLFVAENAAPRRFTRWSPDGRLERQFHGPYYFSGMFGVDDEHPEDVYADTHTDLIRYRVDYQTATWEVVHYWIGAYGLAGVPIKWWPRIRHRNGRTFWCSGSGAICELLEDRVRGIAAVYGGWVARTGDGGYEPVDWRRKTGLKGTWSDLNGDGLKQPEEWQVTDKPAYPIAASGPQQGWGAYFDEHFNLFMHDWSDDAAGGVWEIPVAEWRNGVPVYRWGQAKHVGLPRDHGLQHGASGARTAFSYQGAAYALNGGYNAADLPGVGHGHDYEFAQITKYDEATGKPLWHAGERAASFATPGQHYCPTGPSGVIGDYLFWTDENSLVHVWDVQHGLYVDTLLEDISRGPDPSPYTVWVELFNTRVFRHPQTGKVYLMAGSDAIHVFEILGTEQKMTRFQGTFELTQDGIEKAKRQEQSRIVPKERTLAIRRAPAPPKLDGDLAEFAKEAPAQMVAEANRQATARLLYDDQCLYVAFDVQDDSPWKNAGGDATALFKTGDEVSLWIGPSAGKRPPGLGDVRLLFAPAHGEQARVAVMAYRPKVAQGAKPVTFRSPSGSVTMDKVEELADVRTAVKVSERSYRLAAAIPWSEIGLSPAVERFGLDLSVDFSDPAGQRNIARLHWGRNGAAIVYDLPTEARFEPESWGVGVLAR